MENKLLRRLFIFLLCAVSCGAQVAPGTLDFGVFSLFKPKHLLVRPAKKQTVLLTIDKTTVALDSEFEVTSSREGVRIAPYGRAYQAESLLVTSRDGGATEFFLSVPGKIERKFRGTLRVTGNGLLLHPIVSVDRELAVASAVKAEAPPDAPMEALKAQAVVARSFYLGSRNRHQSFDFCDTTHCQLLKEPPAASDPASTAAQQTRGITLHYRGQIVPAMFSASCGGRTRTLEEVGIVSGDYPYYSVEDAYCDRTARRWIARLDTLEAHALAHSHSEHDRLALGRKVGWNVVPGNNYVSRNDEDTAIFEGKGSGHGLGLCQQGASALARDGANFREILAHYFPNTTVSE